MSRIFLICILGLFSFIAQADEAYTLKKIIRLDNESAEVLSFAKSGGDFEGNGGDPLKLRYALIYNHIKTLGKLYNVEKMVHPNQIFSYPNNTSEQVIYLVKNKIFIPDSLYRRYPDLQELVFTLFKWQGYSIGHYIAIRDAKVRNVLAILNRGIFYNNLYDFNVHLKSAAINVEEFLLSIHYFHPVFKYTLDNSIFSLVAKNIYDNKGTSACAIRKSAKEIVINVNCWLDLSEVEQQLLFAHEIFRILGINDDDYSLTIDFAYSQSLRTLSKDDYVINL